MATRSVTPFQVFLLVLLIIFWGSSFVVVQQLLDAGLTPIAVATFRFIVAGVFFIIALVAKKSVNSSYRLSIEPKDWLVLLVLALVGVTFFFYAQYLGIQMAGPSIAAIMVCLLSPILITVFSAKLFGDRLGHWQLFGVAIAAAGTFFVVFADLFNLQGNMTFLFGTLILLATPVMWAGYSLIGQKIMQKYDAFLVVAYVTLIGAACLVPFSLAEHSFGLLFTMSLNEWLGVIYLSFTCSLLGYYIWFYALKKVGSTASTFLFGEPFITAIFAAVLVNEILSPSVIFGGMLIFFGVLLVTFSNREASA